MKEYRGLPKEMSVPAALDAKVLSYARNSVRRKSLKRKVSWSFAVAAAAFVVAGALFFPFAGNGKSDRISHEELLAMADWSNLERESFDLTMEISFDGDELSDSNDMGLWI